MDAPGSANDTKDDEAKSMLGGNGEMKGRPVTSKGSLGYAQRLSEYKNKGDLGKPELFDSVRALASKSKALAEMIRAADGAVVFHTGAGISTGSGIPDFRGPKGVWTLERKKKQAQLDADVDFELALPSLTHMAIVALIQANMLAYVVSQNVDGLHIRSGVPETHLAELHGNMFCEQCTVCRKKYYRPYDVNGIGCKPTGRMCISPQCPGAGGGESPDPAPLVDTTLDWEGELPQAELAMSEDHCSHAKLSVALGTSLQIIPASELPLLTAQKQEGKLAILNLQATKKDPQADLKINGRCDEVMRSVMWHLGITIPPYIRTERVQVTVSRACRENVKCEQVVGKDTDLVWRAVLRSAGHVDDRHLSYVQSVTFIVIPKDTGCTYNGHDYIVGAKRKLQQQRAPILASYSALQQGFAADVAGISSATHLSVTVCLQAALSHAPVQLDLQVRVEPGTLFQTWEREIEVARKEW